MLLSRGGFELRKWADNSSILLADILPENHGLACSKILQPDDKLKILGITWVPSLYVFQFKVSLKPDPPRSKRRILSTIAKFFDPLGWVTLATVTAKIFMQSLWRLKIAWDDDVPLADLTSWQTIYSQLDKLNDIQIPRWTHLGPDAIHQELHGFADASSVAYAAVIYLKSISAAGVVTISLLTGKSKVAPIKTLSIPRLELSAAVLLARLMRFVRDSIVVRDAECHCWTDSTVVLAWLNQGAANWKTFVANRVASIHSTFPTASWNHVPSADNPADCASRGLLASELRARDIWWNGPPWLSLTPEHWPSPPLGSLLHEGSEKRSIIVNTMTDRSDWDLAEKFSSWPKLLRVIAYLFRFIQRCRSAMARSKRPVSASAALSADEYLQARTFWLKTVQRNLFSAEIVALSQHRPIKPKSPVAAHNPFLDEEGILRVGGRLKNAPGPSRLRFPILLAASPIVTLIIRQAYLRALHAGLQLTLTTLRQDFWILRSRTLVKSIIHNCVVCARERAATPSQLMDNLPACRVTRSTRCFLHCGLDYAGPVLIRTFAGRGVTTRKAYIAFFVCLATRAVHLELVGNYSTTAFLDAYSRFCARRGLPEAMYSDNGTTFIGADRELLSVAYRSALRDENFQNKTAIDQVKWHFIPPSAPHFGGLWEAGMRSVKHHLRRILKNEKLTFEEFSTLLCRIEACLNSRPIAPLKDTLDCYDPLTPGHFLIGTPITLSPEPSVLHVNENRLSRWQRVLHLTERFWKL